MKARWKPLRKQEGVRVKCSQAGRLVYTVKYLFFEKTNLPQIHLISFIGQRRPTRRKNRCLKKLVFLSLSLLMLISMTASLAEKNPSFSYSAARPSSKNRSPAWWRWRRRTARSSAPQAARRRWWSRPALRYPASILALPHGAVRRKYEPGGNPRAGSPGHTLRGDNRAAGAGQPPLQERPRHRPPGAEEQRRRPQIPAFFCASRHFIVSIRLLKIDL